MVASKAAINLGKALESARCQHPQRSCALHRAANRARLALDAVDMLTEQKAGQKFANLHRRVGKSKKFMSDINYGPSEWCPGAELNHRHLHFQCSALPTELPGNLGLLTGAASYKDWISRCPEQAGRRTPTHRPGSLVSSHRSSSSILGYRYNIDAGEPAMKIDIGAALRAERARRTLVGLPQIGQTLWAALRILASTMNGIWDAGRLAPM